MLLLLWVLLLLLMGDADGDEFRTQPLWGLMAVGPYLHDGRATTIEEAIEFHDGEAATARDAYLDISQDEVDDLVAFLVSLGGEDQYTTGLLPPNTPVPSVGEFGGPVRTLSAAEEQRYIDGRELFDHEFGLTDGAGEPRFNGDSCRACHFEPIIGGSGPRGVNVIRHGIKNDDGDFVPPNVGTILHRQTALINDTIIAQEATNVFEHRQTPHLFGLGLIDELDEKVIMAAADPDDLDGDGISGKPGISDGGILSRFGWKAQVPSVAEFVRDAFTSELGMTLDLVEGMTFGRIHDNDSIMDPEVTSETADLLTDFLLMMGPPPRGEESDATKRGEVVFADLGCESCHIPSLEGPSGPVPLYSDLLLHEIMPDGSDGIEDAAAGVLEFRTPPLWGLSVTGPYLHDGTADTIEQAIMGHAGEGTASRDAFAESDKDSISDLIAFLESL